MTSIAFGMIRNKRTGRWRNGYIGGPKLYSCGWITQALRLSAWDWGSKSHDYSEWEVVVFDHNVNRIGSPIEGRLWMMMKGYGV